VSQMAMRLTPGAWTPGGSPIDSPRPHPAPRTTAGSPVDSTRPAPGPLDPSGVTYRCRATSPISSLPMSLNCGFGHVWRIT
jgi:hypothetical protein